MRRDVRRIKLITEGGGPAATCFCGASAWAHDFRRWPMRHVSRCLNCNAQTVTGIEPSPPTSAPKPPASYPPDYGYGPWWGF